MPRRRNLQRLFSTFPNGLPGLGLLLLRAAAGIVLIAEGASSVQNGTDSSLATSTLGLVGLVSGVSLLFGFMTPLGSVIAMLFSAGIIVSWLPQEALLDVVQTRPAAALVAVMAAALAFLGPGAFSIDSRLFGRREIIIPELSRSETVGK